MSLPTEVDVLVVGFGPAGAAAAITAHDVGARVVVVEKTAGGGGNCVHSGGFLFEVEGPGAIDHLDALCFGKTDRDVLTAFQSGLAQLPEFIAQLGGTAKPVDVDAFGGMLPSWPHFPGAGHVHYRQFASSTGERPGLALWHTLEAAVRRRRIPVVSSAPVTKLVIDHEQVTGAIVNLIGEPVAVHANGGVVLASGGFEADSNLCDAYLPLTVVSVGHQGNTGDTLRLAAQVDAKLWHMSAFFGWFAFVHRDFPAAFTLDVHAPSHLMLDGDGRRFADETGWEVHDKVRCATTYVPRRPNRPRMPGWLVFDERARLAGPLHGIVGSPNRYDWSPDNSVEVNAGWILRGDDPAGLAAVTGLDTHTLVDTLGRYSAAVQTGRDPDFGRSPATLVELSAPLYAIRMHPGVATASGGPRRDQFARVTSTSGAPVAGLYAAGGAGSIWGHLTEHGGGLTDALVFGRIAGAQAARRRR